MKKTALDINCYHCGEPVDNADIWRGDKPFCCHGCQTVYDLLAQNELCDYYNLENNPGNSLKHFYKEKYAFLDNNDISDLLSDFKSDTFQKITFHIPSIHCSSCIWLLENIKRFDDGIIQSQINFGKKKLVVDLNPGLTSIRAIVDLLCQLGYEPNISLERNEKKHKSNSSELLVRLGVSGFIFGNVMLLSFPEYLGLGSDSVYQHYFGYINVVLSIPTVIYCGQEFYISAFGALRKRILNIDLPITIGIAALFLRSIFDILTDTGPGYLDSLTGLVFFLLIGRWFQSKTYEGLSFDRNFKSYFPLAVHKVDRNNTKSILVNDILIDDELLIRNEEIIPCDAILLSDLTHIDYSFITGESQLVEHIRKETLYAGGRVKGPSIRIKAIRKVSQGYLTDLWNNPIFSKENKVEESSLIDKVSRYFTPTVLCIALGSAIYWSLTDPSKVLFVVSSVLIIACPCALALATPFTLGSVLNLLGTKGIYLKNTSVIERIWSVRHLIFDKTGTLTSGTDHYVSFHGNQLSQEELDMIKSLTKNSMHPISQQINQHLTTANNNIRLTNFSEKKGMGISGSVGSMQILLGSVELINNTINKVTGTHAHVSINGIYRGYFLIENKYRSKLKEAIQRLRGFNFTVLSGDNNHEQRNLEKVFPKGTKYLFDQSPKDKMEHVRDLSDQCHTMMIGDGLNDSGALQASTVGISVTEHISSFTPASDIIMLGHQVSLLPAILQLTTWSRYIIILGFALSFVYNIVGLGMAVTGLITPVFAAILMPISSISVVVFSTLSVRLAGKSILEK